MSFELREITVPSTDNIHTLVGRIYIPDGEKKGILQVIHGMTEHIERYDSFMSLAAENGYVTFGYDHLGHGKTANNQTEFGFFAHFDGWKYLVNDVSVFANAVKSMYPDLPFTLFGHSMGSFIVRLAAVNKPEIFDKLIVCGTGGANPLAFAGLALTSLIGKIKGEKYISNTVQKMAFGSYNKRFDGNTGHEWLSNDLSIIERYATDPYCNFKFTVSGMHDLIKLNDVCNKNQWFKELPKNMPILLISGDCDPVGDYGKGVEKVYRKAKKYGADIKMKLYEGCRHEILNDIRREEVLKDIFEFIENGNG